ncbi:unnamed protein product [Cochlearia groenlandica]
MDPTNQQHSLSSLPDVLLIMIISLLSFKECIQTSILSKRWRYLCQETKNMSFKEGEYLDHSVSNNRARRNSFIRYITKWVSRFNDKYIESFEICFSRPMRFEEEIESFIEFAVSRKVKKLSLDFSNPAWNTLHDALSCDIAVYLPSSFYQLDTIEELKLYSCGFDPMKFPMSGLPRKFSVGWISIPNIEALITTTSLLESLSISYCWGFTFYNVVGTMKEFTFVNCDLPYTPCNFLLPRVDVFKYSGEVFPFSFEKMKLGMREVHLDFGVESGYDVPTQRTQMQSDVICSFINLNRTAKSFTVCPYLLQCIVECEDPYFYLHPVESQHLVMRTKLQTKEFKGILFLLWNFPKLETLVLDIIASVPCASMWTYAYGGIDPTTFWCQDRTNRVLPKNLKVVIVKNFSGKYNEVNVLKTFIGSVHGQENQETILDKIEIFMKKGMEESRKVLAYEAAEMLMNMAANHVHVVVFY